MTDSGQLQPEETLDDRGVDDVLDEGISPPEKLRGSTAAGVTPYEEETGETLDQRIAQEEPDPYAEGPLGHDLDMGPEGLPAEEDADPADQEAGGERSGRLVAPDLGVDPDTDSDLVARDVGIDGGAASAEEAAVHEIGEVEEVAEPPD